MEVLSSWSGGKDSSLALYKLIEGGYKVKYLLNFISEESGRCCFHGIDGGLLRLQAESLGIPLIQKALSNDMKKYEEGFKEAVSEIKPKGVSAMVFGDIYLDEHKHWVERVCKDIGIIPLEPLWNIPAPRLAEEFIDLGFKALVVSCKADLLGEDFVGEYFDRNMLKEFKKKDICPCGENGEFHTLVTDGPIFKKRIEILESKPLLKDGFWKHWSLDIRKFKLTDKN